MTDYGLVSIITPCYNGAKYISETIESVLAQDYSNWEMIIVDDGSSDNSAEVVAKYVESDARIQYIKQDNAGSAAARNNGIRRCQGRYICLLDADDLWHEDFLSKQLAYMSKKNATCVTCWYSKIDDESKDILNPTTCKEVITLKDMQVMNYVGCLTGLYDTSKHGKIYLKESLKSIRDDYAFWYDIACLDQVIYCNQQVLAKYRVLSNSTTGNKFKLIPKQYAFYRQYIGLNWFKSCVNVIKWGLAGLSKFTGGK